MLGASCSPCCEPCSVSGVRALWESVQQKNCFLSFTTNIAKSDPATSADVAFASATRDTFPYNSDPATLAADLVTNGITFTDRISYYEGHAAVNATRLPLALNMALTSWNSLSGSGVVVLSTNSHPVSCTVRLVFTSGGPTCVSGYYNLSAFKRFAGVRGGAGSIDGVSSSGTVSRYGYYGAEYSIGFAIASAEHYKVSQIGGGGGAPFGPEVLPKVFYALTTFGRYSTASAWWESSRKPAHVPWINEPIFQISGGFQTVTQEDGALSANGSFTSNSALIGGRPYQWYSDPFSPTDAWCSSLSVAEGSTSFQLPGPFNTISLYGPFLRVALSGNQLAYAPVGDPFLSGSIAVVTE